jgi:signal transduction histidine kinase
MNPEANHREKSEPRPPWRLRTRLGLALFIVFIPIAGLIVISQVENQRDRRDARVESFRTIGQTIAAVVEGFTRDLDSLGLATTLAVGDADITLDQQTMGPYLTHIAESYGILRGLFITDVNGKVVASMSGGDSIGRDLSSRNYIQSLQKGADAVWSGAIAGSDSGQTTLAYARTIKDQQGNKRGFFVVAFYPSQLLKRLPDDIPGDAEVSLIDEHGLLLYTSSDPDATGKPKDVSASKAFQDARQGRQVSLRSEPSPVDDGDQYGAFVPVEGTGWVVGFTRPADAIDGPLRNRFLRDAAIVSVSLLAGYFALILVATRLVGPLSSLATAAGAIARGERPVLPSAASDAEVRQLEVAMETMSAAVNDRQERLAAQARVLETLERVGQSMATELDFERAVKTITQAALEITQAEAVGIFYRTVDDGGHIDLLGVTDPAMFPLRGEGPLVQQTLRGETVDIPDLPSSRTPGMPPWTMGDFGPPVRSCLGLPIYSRDGEVFGGLFLLQSQASAFDDYRRRLATGLARRAGVVLENARLYSRMRETQAELEQANRSKTEFIGLMSHELRTPLTTIYGGARLLHTRRSSLTEEDSLELIESIEEESERLYRLIENLLALARADIGEEIARDVFPISPVVDQVVRQFSNRRPNRELKVHLGEDLPEGLPLVWAEATYVRQVLGNLISNADKYSPTGAIEIIATATDEELEMRVLDRGPGVPPEEIDQIFGSFYRSQTTANKAQGKGLGLTVVRRLVEAMDGRIWAQLREGGGLEVGFSLPLAGEPEAVAAAATD